MGNMSTEDFDPSSRALSAGVPPRAPGFTSGGQLLFRNRLRGRIRQLANDYGGYLPLERAIRESFNPPPPASALLSRRQLQKLASGSEDIPLHLDQLDLLNQFLRLRRQESLEDMLNPPTVLRFMAEEGSIGFVLGSQPHVGPWRRMDVFSRWDMSSIETISKGLYATNLPLHIHIEDVMFRGQKADHLRDGGSAQTDEAWLHLVGNLRSTGNSLIVLGSPKVNHAAEKVLATMLGVSPFTRWPRDKIERRPFAFLWPDWCQNGNHPESCLHFDPATDVVFKPTREEAQAFQYLTSDKWVSQRSEELTDEQRAEQRKELPFDCAVYAGGKFYPIRQSGDKWQSYAIIAVRRVNHRTCACICGATGPATFAAARILEHFVPGFASAERDDRMAWCLVEADVEDWQGTGYRADKRQVVAERIKEEVRFYSPERRATRSGKV